MNRRNLVLAYQTFSLACVLVLGGLLTRIDDFTRQEIVRSLAWSILAVHLTRIVIIQIRQQLPDKKVEESGK